MLPYINFIAFLPLIQGFGSKGNNVWFPAKVEAGALLPSNIKRLSQAQLRVVTLVSHWRLLISRSINFSILM
jgi:hypothetical protein